MEDDPAGKRRIKPVIVESGGESLPSPDIPETPVAASEEKPVPKTPTQGEKTKAVPQPPEASQEKKSNALVIILVTVLVALLVALLAGGIYVYSTGIKSGGVETPTAPLPTPTPFPLPTPTPASSPSATPKVDLAKYKVSILNGSGKIGEAGKAKTLIEKEGFKVVNTGNAASFDFGETLIQAKADVPEGVVASLEETLAGTYSVKLGQSLKDTSTYDIVITVGAK